MTKLKPLSELAEDVHKNDLVLFYDNKEQPTQYTGFFESLTTGNIAFFSIGSDARRMRYALDFVTGIIDPTCSFKKELVSYYEVLKRAEPQNTPNSQPSNPSNP